MVYHQIREDLEAQGVIFLDTDTALREHSEIFKEYFGTVIPAGDNKFAALNTAVWSGGSFVYVPKGVHVEIPLQAYFRINTENMGQFERTLIIADEGFTFLKNTVRTSTSLKIGLSTLYWWLPLTFRPWAIAIFFDVRNISFFCWFMGTVKEVL